MKQKIVAITGANRGLGLALVKRIAESQNDFTKILLCSRDEKKGQDVKASLGKQRIGIDIVKLDMANEESIETFCDSIGKTYGRLNSVVHNAGIMLKDEKDLEKEALFEKIAQTNLFGPISLTEQLLENDLLDEQGRLIFISSKLATSRFVRDDKLKQLLEEINSVQTINTAYAYIYKCLKEGKGNELFQAKFPFPEYSILKLLLSKYCKTLAQGDDIKKRNIFVASLCPGWCRTDMGGEMATNSIESGTDISYDLLTRDQSMLSSLEGQFVYKIGAGLNV